LLDGFTDDKHAIACLSEYLGNVHFVGGTHIRMVGGDGFDRFGARLLFALLNGRFPLSSLGISQIWSHIH